jgi:hypothetical protein
MKKYQVGFDVIGQRVFECEANSQEEAEEKFYKWQESWDVNDAIQVFLDEDCDFPVSFVSEDE